MRFLCCATDPITFRNGPKPVASSCCLTRISTVNMYVIAHSLRRRFYTMRMPPDEPRRRTAKMPPLPLKGNARATASPSQSRHQNHLLDALPTNDYERVASHLELIPLKLGDDLYESGGRLPYVYFPTTAIISLLYVMEDGASAEIAIVSNEGMFGESALTHRLLAGEGAIFPETNGPKNRLRSARPNPARFAAPRHRKCGRGSSRRGPVCQREASDSFSARAKVVVASVTQPTWFDSSTSTRCLPLRPSWGSA